MLRPHPFDHAGVAVGEGGGAFRRGTLGKDRKDCLVRFWNEGAERIFGYSRDEALGRSLDLIIPERLRERHGEGYRKVMATGVTRYGDEVLAVPALRRDGGRISIEFTILLVRNEAGDLLGTAAFIRDVTARWEKEKELKRRLAELEAKLSPPG